MMKTDERRREERRRAASRQRRLIFNDDTHELALAEANTPAGFLGHRISPLAGTQVGTIAWSVLCGQFDAPAYDSQVQPIYGDAQGGPVRYWEKVTTNVKALAQTHHCPLPMTSKRGALRTGVIGRVPLVVGDDLVANPPAGATLTVGFDAAAWKEALLFRLNGKELTAGAFVPPSGDQPNCHLRYPVEVAVLKTGLNTIELAARHVDLPEKPVIITAMRLRVEY